MNTDICIGIGIIGVAIFFWLLGREVGISHERQRMLKERAEADRQRRRVLYSPFTIVQAPPNGTETTITCDRREQ